MIAATLERARTEDENRYENLDENQCNSVGKKWQVRERKRSEKKIINIGGIKDIKMRLNEVMCE